MALQRSRRNVDRLRIEIAKTLEGSLSTPYTPHVSPVLEDVERNRVNCLRKGPDRRDAVIVWLASGDLVQRVVEGLMALLDLLVHGPMTRSAAVQPNF